jgi:hypothetical protein
MTTMTEKQQRAVEALEAARQEGVTLTAYAKAKGLVIRDLYDALAGLRRKGLLPRSTRKSRSRFLAVHGFFRVRSEANKTSNRKASR